MAVPCLALGAAIERLGSAAAEEWSHLTGVPVLAVDARGREGPASPSDAVTAAAIRLGALACPSIVLTDGETPAAARAFVAACDVVVATRAELDALVAAVEATPIAAATLCQVLRGSETRSIADGLVVESLAYAALQAGPEHARWLAARGPAGARAAEGPTVVVERTTSAWRITLDRPRRHNAFSARMRDELCEALTLAAVEPLPVEIRGAGPSFCSGGDLDEFGTRADPATAHLLRTTRSPARLLAALAARVRIAVHGACIGAGIELAALAGYVTATADAFIQLPEVGMGLIPGAGGTVSLPRRIGRQRTAELALGGRRMDAAAARAWGLIDAIVDAAHSP